MTWFFTSRLGRAFAAVGAVIVALVGVFALGRRDGRRDGIEQDLRRYQETSRRMDDADVGSGASDDDNVRWLRDRAKW